MDIYPCLLQTLDHYQIPLEPWPSHVLTVLPCLVCKMGTIVFTGPFNKATVKFTYLMSVKRLKTETRRSRRIVSFIQLYFIWVASWLIPRAAVRGWPIWQKLMLFIFVLHWKLMLPWLGFQAKKLVFHITKPANTNTTSSSHL